jgi:hypothetical protein
MSEHDEYKETWFIAPRTIVDMPGMTLAYIKVFETIFQFWNKGRKCYLSNPEIERRTGVKITAIKEAIAYFEKHGELERIQIGMKRYLMQPLKVVEIPGLAVVPQQVAAPAATCATVNQVAAPAASKNCTGGRSGGYEVAAIAATEIKKLNKEKKNIYTSANAVNEVTALFTQFYEIYPRKKDKQAALKAFTKLKPTQEFVSMLIEDVYKRLNSEGEWKGKEPKFIPYPASYLNGKRWEDAIEEVVTQKSAPALKYVPKEDRAAEYEKIKAREDAEERAKKQLIEDSKGFKNIVKEAKEKISFKERLRLYELDQERIKNELENTGE